MKLINSILGKIFSLTLTSKIFNLLKSIYVYNKDYNIISDMFYGDGFKKIIKTYLHVDIKKDWIGRLYGVVNPNIDIDGNFNINNIIIELDGNLTNNNEYVTNWIYKQLKLVQELFNFDNFYNYISLDIMHVGPSIADNYLIIFDIASRKNISKYLKQTLLQVLIYCIIAAIVLIFIYNKL